MDNDHDQDITASRLFSCFSSNSSLVPTQTTDIPGHWLADSPGKLLDNFNIEQGLAGVDGFPYNVLIVRILIFYKDAVLLTREGNDWTVPTMYFPDTDVAPNRLVQRIVTYLKKIDTPINIMHELQFMEFSHGNPAPLTATAPKQKTIMTVLTTSCPELPRNVASWDQIFVPQGTKFRWINKDCGAMTNLSPQTTPGGDLTPQIIQQAYERLTTCSKHTLLGRAAASVNPPCALASVCNSMITSILITRTIVKGQDTPGYGRVLVDKTPGKRELFFSGNMSAGSVTVKHVF